MVSNCKTSTKLHFSFSFKIQKSSSSATAYDCFPQTALWSSNIHLFCRNEVHNLLLLCSFTVLYSLTRSQFLKIATNIFALTAGFDTDTPGCLKNHHTPWKVCYYISQPTALVLMPVVRQEHAPEDTGLVQPLTWISSEKQEQQ